MLRRSGSRIAGRNLILIVGLQCEFSFSVCGGSSAKSATTSNPSKLLLYQSGAGGNAAQILKSGGEFIRNEKKLTWSSLKGVSNRALLA